MSLFKSFQVFYVALAKVKRLTSLAPASLKIFAHINAVLPVVATSSTRSILLFSKDIEVFLREKLLFKDSFRSAWLFLV